LEHALVQTAAGAARRTLESALPEPHLRLLLRQLLISRVVKLPRRAQVSAGQRGSLEPVHRPPAQQAVCSATHALVRNKMAYIGASCAQHGRLCAQAQTRSYRRLSAVLTYSPWSCVRSNRSV